METVMGVHKIRKMKKKMKWSESVVVRPWRACSSVCLLERSYFLEEL